MVEKSVPLSDRNVFLRFSYRRKRFHFPVCARPDHSENGRTCRNFRCVCRMLPPVGIAVFRPPRRSFSSPPLHPNLKNGEKWWKFSIITIKIFREAEKKT